MQSGFKGQDPAVQKARFRWDHLQKSDGNQKDPTMTTDERLARIETAIEGLAQQQQALTDQQKTLLTAIDRIGTQLDAEVRRWDERFYQLSRDTLVFTRNIVTIAAVTAVLIPLLRDVTPLLTDAIRQLVTAK
jgi:hypothetical protein